MSDRWGVGVAPPDGGGADQDVDGEDGQWESGRREQQRSR